MNQPGPFLKRAVIVWSILLGTVFVIGYTAVAVMGTKSTFTTVKMVGPGAPSSAEPVPPATAPR